MNFSNNISITKALILEIYNINYNKDSNFTNSHKQEKTFKIVTFLPLFLNLRKKEKKKRDLIQRNIHSGHLEMKRGVHDYIALKL